MAEYTARLRRVDHTWKSSGVHACSNVNLELGAGEIHALVGENGAGKTTLGHIAAGIRQPDSGSILFRGNEINLSSRPAGLLDGIGLVRQHSIWPGTLTAWESAVFARKDRPRKKKDAIGLFRETAAEWKLGDINPLMPVSRMNAATLQRAELIAALMFSPGLLILDEPASAWEESRSGEFGSLMDGIRSQGISLLLITHRIDDVFRFADNVTVLRHGSVCGTWPTAGTDKKMVITEMFGEIPDEPDEENGKIHRSVPSETAVMQPPALSAESLLLTASGRSLLKSVSFAVRSGEILALTGLREEGLGVLEDVITGNRKPVSGDIRINGRKLTGNPSAMRRAGVRYIPSDKTGRGSSMDSTMTENMLVLNSKDITRKGILHPSKMHRWTEKRRREGRIDGQPEQRMSELSGGNIQKVILEREFHGQVPVIVAADPTWGLDERSRTAVHRRIRKNADEGSAVLLMATDLDEALENCDRLAVVSSGRISEIKPVGNWTRDEIASTVASDGAVK